MRITIWRTALERQAANVWRYFPLSPSELIELPRAAEKTSNPSKFIPSFLFKWKVYCSAEIENCINENKQLLLASVMKPRWWTKQWASNMMKTLAYFILFHTTLIFRKFLPLVLCPHLEGRLVRTNWHHTKATFQREIVLTWETQASIVFSGSRFLQMFSKKQISDNRKPQGNHKTESEKCIVTNRYLIRSRRESAMGNVPSSSESVFPSDTVCRPSPGLTAKTSVSPCATARNVVEAQYRSALRPSLPDDLKSRPDNPATTNDTMIGMKTISIILKNIEPGNLKKNHSFATFALTCETDRHSRNKGIWDTMKMKPGLLFSCLWPWPFVFPFWNLCIFGEFVIFVEKELPKCTAKFDEHSREIHLLSCIQILVSQNNSKRNSTSYTKNQEQKKNVCSPRFHFVDN